MITTHTLIHADPTSTILWLAGLVILSVLGRGRVKLDLNM